MIQFSQAIWRKWQKRYCQRIVDRHLAKRTAILQQGLKLYAYVQDGCNTRFTVASVNLVRLRLSIPLNDRLAMEAVSAAFVACDARQLIGKRLCIRFLPGDLSHVVITL